MRKSKCVEGLAYCTRQVQPQLIDSRVRKPWPCTAPQMCYTSLSVTASQFRIALHSRFHSASASQTALTCASLSSCVSS